MNLPLYYLLVLRQKRYKEVMARWMERENRGGGENVRGNNLRSQIVWI